MSEFSLILTSDDINTLKEDLEDRSLKAPTAEENPTFKPGRGDGLGTWKEVLKVNDVVVAPAKDQPHIPVVKLIFEVLGADNGGYEKNRGRTHYENIYVDAAAYASPMDKNHDKARRAVGILLSFIDAAGIPRDGSFDLLQALSAKAGQGSTVIGIINKWSFVDRQTQATVRRCNAVGFATIGA